MQNLAVLLLISVFASGHAGQIKGRVVSKPTGEALAGVTVLLQGTLRGAVTDVDGTFLLTSVADGEHALSFSHVGYQRETVKNIKVSGGMPVEVFIELVPALIQTEAVVVTASRREQSLEEVPSSISVMEALSIARHDFPSVEDAMRYVPGVNLVESQVSIRGSSGYSRGAGSRVLMLVDGTPLLPGDTGELNFETLPIGQVDRIEVLKGAGSALYGSNALGGVINVITKPIPENPETRIRLYGGIYGAPSYPEWDWGGGARLFDGEAFTHGRRFGDTRLLLHGSRRSDDGFRQNDHRRRYNGYLRMRHDFSSHDALTGTFNILHQSRGSFLSWKDLGHALVPPDVQQGDRVQSDRFFLSGQYQHVASPELLYVFRGMWFRNRFQDDIDTVTHRSLSDVFRGEGQLTWSFHPAHILTLGVEGSLQDVEADLFGNHSGGGGAVYAQDEVKASDEVRLTLGARFDIQDVDSLDTDSQLSPKLAVLYTPAATTRLRASFGRGFRSPTVAEAFVRTTLSLLTIVPNPGLQSERSHSYEIGLNQALGESMLLDMAIFQSDFSNLIEPTFITGSIAQFTNVTKARIQGAEVNLKLGLFSKVLLFDVGYTYVYPRDLTNNDILKYRPRHLLYMSALLQRGPFMCGADFRYLSKIEKIDEVFRIFVADADARVSVFIADVRAGMNVTAFGMPLSVTLNIGNIFQYNYVELVGNLQPPRSYSVTAEAVL